MSDIQPLSPQEVDEIEQNLFLPVRVMQWLATVRHRERQRDESELKASKAAVDLIYQQQECRRTIEMFVTESREIRAERDELQRQLNEYSGWSPHQFEGVMREHRELQVKFVTQDSLIHDLKRQLYEARNECHCEACWLQKNAVRIAQGQTKPA